MLIKGQVDEKDFTEKRKMYTMEGLTVSVTKSSTKRYQFSSAIYW